MRSRTAEDLGGRCPRCYLLPCLCGEVPALQPRLEVVVIRHFLEALKGTNSARWAMLALPNAQVHEWGLLDSPLKVDELVAPDTWVLFPMAEATPAPAVPPKRLLVMDGSWTQARRMFQRIPALRGLPKLSLPPPPMRPRLRSEHLENGMSTMEAIAAAYEFAGEPHVAGALVKLYLAAVDRAQRIRGRRTVPGQG